MTGKMSAPIQYGGNTPPPGYVQFKVQNSHGITGTRSTRRSSVPVPFLIWVKAIPTARCVICGLPAYVVDPHTSDEFDRVNQLDKLVNVYHVQVCSTIGIILE